MIKEIIFPKIKYYKMEKVKIYKNDGSFIIKELPNEDMLHWQIVDFIDEIMGGNDNWNSYDIIS